MLASENMNTKRAYTRRSDEERIAELQAQISNLQTKVAQKERPDAALLREVPRVQRRLRKFAQKALDLGRADLANSVLAFIAGLERAAEGDAAPVRRGRRTRED